jgi:hypothetical protein
MKTNIGKLDRIFRIALAIILLAIALTGFIVVGKIAKIAMVLIAVILIFTATIRVCPMYLPFGIRTNKD